MSSISGVWWTPSPRNARKTAAAAAAIGVSLALVSAFVWYSPANPVGPVHISAQAAKASAVDKLREGEHTQLLNSVAALKQKLAEAQATALAAQQAAADASTNASSTTRAYNALKKSSAKAAQVAASAAAAAAAASAGNGVVSAASGATNHGTTGTVAAGITAPSLKSIIHPSSKLFGMYTSQAPFNFATFDDTASKLGVAPNVVGYFGGWDQAYRPDAVSAAWKRGSMPVLTWESRPIKAGNDAVTEPDYTLPKILAGNFDSYLHKYARSIVKAGLPLGIRFDHEMNGIWYPWSETDGKGASLNGNNVGDYVKVWQYVHDIFQEEGANKYVAWIWSPNITNNLPASHKTADFLKALYPGDAYVDWVGLSGYLRPAYKADNDFSFDYTFGPSLNALRTLTSKPIFLSEIGASEVGGHKATWINSLFAALEKPENSDVLGFSWFNLAVTSYTEGQLATNDWRIDSRADTLAAFKTGITAKGNGFDLKAAK